MSDAFVIVGHNYLSTADVPRDDDLYYRCDDCGDQILSVPIDNIGCKCGNIFIDKDYWRLIVADLNKLTVVRKERPAIEAKPNLLR
jgi:hypothetical protein